MECLLHGKKSNSSAKTQAVVQVKGNSVVNALLIINATSLKSNNSKK